ncbi:hypothetical protein JXA40_03650 [bacterium]|nr:hypothetical protein [candidate division CSSED10-310 bacterium]
MSRPASSLRRSLLEIAHIRLDIQSELPILIDPSNKSYPAFRMPGPGSPLGKRIPVKLVPDRFPTVRQDRRIFFSGSAWSVYRVRDAYLLCMQPESFDEPLWIAAFDPGFGVIRVYCSRKIIEEHDRQRWILNPVVYPLDQLMMMNILSQNRGLIIHAAGVLIDGEIYVFPGRSGGGKSTLSRAFLGADGTVVLSDDRIIIRKSGNGYQAYGTPWPGELGCACSLGGNLKGIFFLTRARTNRIEAISAPEALKALLPCVSIPWYDDRVFPLIIETCSDLLARIPCHRLHFQPGNAVVETVTEYARS